ncbi:MAG: ArsC family reductase [Rhodocyclaceae bacterium]
MIRIYGIRNCTTMRKAFAWLDEHGVRYDFHDYRKAGVPVRELERWVAVAGWPALANKHGTTWKRIPEDSREGLDAKRAIELLCAWPSAIRRPVLDTGSHLLVGFDPGLYAGLISPGVRART